MTTTREDGGLDSNGPSAKLAGRDDLGTRVAGWAVGGALAAGAVSLVGALISLVLLKLMATAICALGAAVAFGSAANAVLRR